MQSVVKPSDLINNEIRDLQGRKTKLALSLWELMKSLRTEEIRQDLASKKKLK